MTERGPISQTRLALRLAPQAFVDVLAWSVALVLAITMRMDFKVSAVPWAGVALLLPLVWLTQIETGLWFGLYLGRSRYGSFEEVAGLARAVAATTCIIFLIDLLAPSPRMVPLSTTLAGGFIALVLMGSIRYARRLYRERCKRPAEDGTERIVVFGAGEAGSQVITAMLRDPSSPYLPVALLDDDRAKRNLRIMGVPVVGTRAQLAKVAADHGASTVLIAIPSATSAVLLELSGLVEAAGLRTKVLPSIQELYGDAVSIDDIRDVTPADVLGRHEIKTDLEAIAGYLTGKRVLVTGAGGSIGSELCRQLHQFAPAELIMVDRDESALHAVQLSIDGRALLDRPDTVLLCIRDQFAVRRVMNERRPQVVFHAAALKHLPLLEQYPGEAVLTNVWGTLNLLEAAAERQGRAVRQHLHRQGGRPDQRPRLQQAARRAAHRMDGAASDRCLPQCPVRQRARQPGLGAHLVPSPDGRRRTDHGHRSRCHPVLHDGRGGGRAGHPGRRHRPQRRGAGASTWATRCASTTSPGSWPRPGRPQDRHRLHRAAARARSSTRFCWATARSMTGPCTP